jgi:hypothetical protein
MASSVMLSPLLRGMIGACNGLNVHHRGENPDGQSKSPLPSAPNGEVVYDTSLGTSTGTARGGSLMEGIRLLMLKQDGLVVYMVWAARA